MSNCTTVFHSIPKVHKIIKELVYGNVAGLSLSNISSKLQVYSSPLYSNVYIKFPFSTIYPFPLLVLSGL